MASSFNACSLEGFCVRLAFLAYNEVLHTLTLEAFFLPHESEESLKGEKEEKVHPWSEKPPE